MAEAKKGPSFWDIFSTLVPLVPSVLSLLGVGGKDDDQTTTQKTTSPPGYQSPFLGLTDATMFDSLIKNLGAFSKFGMPGGTQRFSGYTDAISKMMGPEMEKLIGGGIISPEDQANKACYDGCDKYQVLADNAERSGERVKWISYKAAINTCTKRCEGEVGPRKIPYAAPVSKPIAPIPGQPGLSTQ